MKKVEALRRALWKEVRSVQEAMKDERCHDVARWLLVSIMEPDGPAAVAVPDPDAPGGEVVAALCRRFGIA